MGKTRCSDGGWGIVMLAMTKGGDGSCGGAVGVVAAEGVLVSKGGLARESISLRQCKFHGDNLALFGDFTLLVKCVGRREDDGLWRCLL